MKTEVFQNLTMRINEAGYQLVTKITNDGATEDVALRHKDGQLQHIGTMYRAYGGWIAEPNFNGHSWLCTADEYGNGIEHIVMCSGILNQ